MDDRPQSSEHLMIIDRPAQLAGKDCAAYGVLHATDGALVSYGLHALVRVERR